MAYKPSSDRTLFVTASLLTVFGLVMVYSASSVLAANQHGGMSSYYFRRQLIFAALGYALMVIMMNVDYHFWQREKLIKVLLVVSAASLVLVLTQPTVNGSHRWLRYGPSFSFQPSEAAKLVLLIFLASYLHKNESTINRLRESLFPCLAVVGLFVGLIAVEEDLGQAVTITFITVVLLFAAGLSWRYIAAAAAAALPVFYFKVWLEPFRFNRMMTFLDRSHDPLGSGWQINQALTAIGSGGLLGLGLGGGRQKLGYIPEPQSDFIFAVIGEEIGLIGTTLVCLAFLIFFYRGIKIALKAPDLFGYYLALGITLMVALQAFINISMVLQLMPTKGIALPFISQGGSSLLLNLVSTGVLLNISNYVEKG